MSAERQPRQAPRAALSPRWPESRGGESATFPETISGRAGGSLLHSPRGPGRVRPRRLLHPRFRVSCSFIPNVSRSSRHVRAHSQDRCSLFPQTAPFLLPISLSPSHAQQITWPPPLVTSLPTRTRRPRLLPVSSILTCRLPPPFLTHIYTGVHARTHSLMHTHTCPGYNLQTPFERILRRLPIKTIKTPRLPFGYCDCQDHFHQLMPGHFFFLRSADPSVCS